MERSLPGIKGVDVESIGLWNDSELKNLFDHKIDPPEDFKDYNESIDTDHTCPKCGYQWTGKTD